MAYVSNLQIESLFVFEHLFALGDNDNQTVLNLAGFTASSHLRSTVVTIMLPLHHYLVH